MKTKKINLNWQSVLLGMALCMVLVFFMGSKIIIPKSTGQDGTVRPLTGTELMAKYDEIQKQMAATNNDLIRIEQKINGLVEEVHQVLKIVRVMDKENR